ncbi:uncharacterized protein EDB91DRAFT_1340148 [Suillus paluster]|uniref:uncharacterized protein n=1 Tax=Suillus paluster TaxID=48578 RepID=UPI001B85C11A|nr:uncharacterized protein EDB91DRAFT_1340148 [Suillus paluster]KAG1723840.1 hypothetical protein EDB91DRAFT_1340148 [Suillus paluster]
MDARPTSILHRTPWTPPIAIATDGVYIDLEDGRRVIDGIGGAAVTCIGGRHPKVVKALKDQIDVMSYVYNMQLSSPPAEELAKLLVDTSDGAFEQVAFLSGGSEAMETVIKLSRQYYVEVGQPKRTNYIARQMSFHGNTLSTLSLAYHPGRRAPYEAILDHQNFHHVSPAYAKRFQKPDETEEQYVERLQQELEDKFIELGPDTVIGFIAETVVGATTGVVSAPKGYFNAMKSVCHKYGALFMLDEVMSGMGRMGTLHAWQSLGDGVAPDLQAVAKGLGGGYAAIGAVLISPKVAKGIRGSSGLIKHGHTYQANPLACAASLAVQKVIIEEDLLAQCRKNGVHMLALLKDRLQSPNALAAPYTFDVRGAGAFFGIELDFSSLEARRVDMKGQQFAMVVQARCLTNGLVAMGMAGGSTLDGSKGDHLMLGPAYNATTEEIEKIVDIFVKSIEEYYQSFGCLLNLRIDGWEHVLMDYQPIHQQEATSSSVPLQPPESEQAHFPATSASASTTEFKPTRSSARVKAAKQKEKEREQAKDREGDSAEQSVAVPSESTRATRSTTQTKNKRPREGSSGNGKSKEISDETTRVSKSRGRRATLPSASAPPLAITEPIKDRKGKKRAAPEPDSEEEGQNITLSSKRTRTTAYSLRSRADASTSASAPMPRKPRPSASKAKAAVKSKSGASAGPSKMAGEDVAMLDPAIVRPDEPAHEELPDGCDDDDIAMDDQDNGGDGEGDDNGDEGGLPAAATRGFAGLDESAAMAIFGDYRQFGSYMVSLSSRLKTMLNNIKSTASPTTRLVTLQELSELLSISTEDTLAGSFQVEQFVRELVKILGGRGVDEDEDDDGGDDGDEHDEDAALAAALALSGGGTYQGDENLEAQMLACRCLANLMEALPGVAHSVVYHGAIPVLCSKLIEISYIDLAEQTLSTLEKISEEFPSSIVRENGLAALLNYLDFFSIAVQRTALQAAANCCRNISPDHFQMILGVWPIIRNCIGYSDQRLVEFACLCVIRVVDSYHRSATENLENLLDETAIRAINLLLMPAGGSPLIAANTFTLLLKALATAARASPKITLNLLQADIVDTLYQILTGVLPSASGGGDEQGGQGLAGDVTHMTVMENLAHRSKEQVEEALSLVSELMPPLPKDGVFDHKGYTDKALTRMVKAKAKADRAAARHAAFTSYQPSPDVSAQATPAAEPFQDTSMNDFQMQDPDDIPPLPSAAEPAVADRTELLRSKPEVVGRFMQLMVPILIDVYAASVITPVRVKTLTGLLKAVGFLEGDALKDAFNLVPVASFASSILSSKDHPSLVIGALQLVDLLLQKLPAEYRPVLRREGVFHEIESLATRTLTSAKSKDSDGTIVAEPMNIPIHVSSTIPGYKKLHSLSLEPEDAITLRARVIRFKYSLGQEEGDEDNAFDELRRLVDRLAAPDVGESVMSSALRDIADHFTSHSSVSSFELLQSGAVDGLLRFATDPTRSSVTNKRRQELLYDAFSRIPRVNQSPLTVLVKKLQESLTRMEDFDVVTVSQGTDDSKRSSPSLLARQLRLRLVADNESDIPRNLQNMVVSIHAIATFQALNDYLRPRITGLMSSGGLSGMLAALAASGFGPVGSRNPPEAPMQASKPVESSSATKTVPETPAAGSSEIGRRRSLRLSAKNGGPSTDKSEGSTTSAPTSVPTASSSAAAPQSTAQRMEALIQDGGLISDFTDDEVDAEVFEDEDDIDSAADKTVTLSIADDGSKVEAQTPDGTRVATPSTAPLISSSRPSNANKTSYAAALKAKPADWHLEFSMDDHLLPLDLTIYGAIHQHEIRKKLGPVPSSSMWQGIYTVKFKKVNGPPPSQEPRADTSASKIRSPSPTLSSLPDDAPHAKILRLLRVLHKLNAAEAQRPARPLDRRALSEATFINNKLTAKLTRQLEEPMIVVSSCLPDWALDLPQNFPFLFPFATRYNYLQSTSFGYARLILKWQSQQGRSQDSSRRDEGIGFLGRLQRQKVRISRKHILESAVKVFELYGSSSSILEVEYFDEVGTGLGPTLEFYSLVSKEFARRDLKIWRDADSAAPGIYVHHPAGLYPAPISPDDIANDGGQKRTHILRVVGQYVAKAMLDSRIIDLSVNKVFVKLVLGEEVPLTIESLKLVDNELASSLSKLQSYASMKGQSEKLFRKVALMDIVNVEELALDFTVPGYDIELRPGGRNIPVTSENAEEYIHEVLDAIIGAGVQPQARAFREGFSKVFPISDLQAFSADELVMLFGNSDEDWGAETLNEAIKADHGFHSESRAIRELIGIMSEFDACARRDFLQFITGSPKLPIGGFRGLNPPLTVVRKPHEPPLIADDYLPSVMTCVNYLKLPEYSSKVVMREKLRIAMKEGVGSFHLS